MVTSVNTCCEIKPLSDKRKAKMVQTGTWKPDCPVGIDRLRRVTFTHYDFSNEKKQGKIIVLDAVAESTATVFETLFRYNFPIAQAKAIEQFKGDDRLSMASNNSSAFNFRPIANTTRISIHSYGTAIDINPVQNPCIELQPISDPEEVRVPVQPAEGQKYLNRIKVRPGMVEQVLDASTGLTVVELFKQNGFHIWGGTWNNPVDWQHFQPSRATAEWLAFMNPEDAAILFRLYTANPTLLNNSDVRDFDFRSLYETNRSQFMQCIQSPGFWEKSPKDAYAKIAYDSCLA